MKEFFVKNGILHENGKPVMAIGTSYYPSFFPGKTPLLPHEDRIGNMKLDLAEMVESGLNMARVAALGDVSRSPDGGISCEFPFIESMCEHAGEAGISMAVRLTGYSFNFCQASDALKQDAHGDEIPSGWATFLPICVQHPGVVKDNCDAIMASAARFAKHPSVVAFQSYNEPHTCGEKYDYNPLAIRGWRKWLVDSGRKSEAEVKGLDAPRRRPAPGEDASLWASWLVYKSEAMNDYLKLLSDKIHEATPSSRRLESFVGNINHGVTLGCDHYLSAEGQDILGFDNYTQTLGPNYHLYTIACDICESAAAAKGKHGWIAELNCKTDLSAKWHDRETVAAVGSGMKGLLYYEWRAEPKRPGSPEGEMFGMLYSDRRRTPKYERAKAMNFLLHSIEEHVVGAEKLRQGVALLDSAEADALHEAREPATVGLSMRMAYRGLRMAGFAVDFIRASELERNPFGVKALVLPEPELLSEKERAQVAAFKAKGGIARDYKRLYDEFENDLDAAGLMKTLGIEPMSRFASPYLDVKVLRANDGKSFLVCLVNFDGLEAPVAGGRLELNLEGSAGIRSAEFMTSEKREELKFDQRGEKLFVELPSVEAGAFLLLKK